MPAEFDKSVFINCPFDSLFEPLFHAIVLTVAALGFTPRCARESEGQAEPRIIRIAKGLSESKYSIHDLSRYQGEGELNLPRFNMPLELGMAVGMTHLRESTARPHNWVVLVPPGFVHHLYISDLLGFDAPDHDGQARAVIQKVSAWLKVQPDFNPPAPTALAILEAYPGYCALLEDARKQALDSLTWPIVVRTALAIVRDLPASQF
jgi:hypothetical protein